MKYNNISPKYCKKVDSRFSNSRFYFFTFSQSKINISIGCTVVPGKLVLAVMVAVNLADTAVMEML